MTTFEHISSAKTSDIVQRLTAMRVQVITDFHMMSQNSDEDNTKIYDLLTNINEKNIKRKIMVYRQHQVMIP